MDKYRIPAMVFSEGFIQPQKFDTLMSQIDVMPTVFGLLNFSYKSKFLGQDVFKKNSSLKLILRLIRIWLCKKQSPDDHFSGEKSKKYSLELEKSDLAPEFKLYYNEKLLKNTDQKLVDDAISAYQSTSYWLKTKQLNR
jgi:phosphoglycerol transferase MdoB-like AlkP superfamily enzyme